MNYPEIIAISILTTWFIAFWICWITGCIMASVKNDGNLIFSGFILALLLPLITFAIVVFGPLFFVMWVVQLIFGVPTKCSMPTQTGGWDGYS